ncbi:MAG TPA: hypothetical protein DCX64_06100 [Gammaproteobacteria bacterium]|nr:cysteine-rich CWC family protein [Gammaproteobacteria bacterium]HAY41833.1 hypothetical protein [Gammaproteobacteria bacterium]
MVDEYICPFCGRKNDCMAKSDEPCWCINAVVPDSLIILLPAKQKMKACICVSCIEEYNDNPKNFISNLTSFS